MFKLNRIFYIFGITLLGLAALVSAQVNAITDVTPIANENWSAGSLHAVDWSHPNNNFYNFSCIWSVSLVPNDSNSGLPTYAGSIVNTYTGRITLPADAVPGAYRARVNCFVFNIANESVLSAGIVTVSNPSFQPLTFVQPATPISYLVGDYVPVTINAHNALAVGTPVIIKLVKKSDQRAAWQATGNLTDVGSPGNPYFGTAITQSESSQFAGGVYLLKAEVQFNGQTYVTSSGDITFTAPAPTADKFVIGDRVVTNATVNVRDAANGAIIDTKQAGAHGTVIIGGPIVAGGFTWWQIDYDCGVTGWSVENFLDKYAGSVVDDCGTTPPDDDGLPPPPHRSWAPPLYAPTECDGSLGFDPGCWPPINVSARNQIKATGDGSDPNYLGGLAIGPLVVDGGALIRGVLKLPSLIAPAGQFLTTDSTGKVILGTPSGGPGPGGTPDNYSCPDGQSIGTIVNGAVTRCEPDDTGGGSFNPNADGDLTNCIDSGDTYKKIVWNGTKLVCGEDKTAGGATGDNLGNHTMTQNLKTNGFYISKDGDSEGIYVNADGSVVTSGLLVAGAVRITGSSPSDGKVLTAKDANGNAEWRTVSAVGGVSKITAGNNISISPAAGTGEVKVNNTTYAVTDNSTLTSVFTPSPAGSSVGYNTFSIKDDGITTTKYGANSITGSKIANSAFIEYAKTPNKFDALRTFNLGEHKACFISRFAEASNVTQLIICSVRPGNSNNGSDNGTSVTGADGWNVGTTRGNWVLETQGVDSCRVICIN